jgi:endogenous inhibitor of DNA gyrase (YacG/DUF329 family)
MTTCNALPAGPADDQTTRRMRTLIDYACAWCGETFRRRPSRTRPAKFCSPRCSGLAGLAVRVATAKAKNSTHTCEQCGKTFHRKHSSRRVHKYCSQRCFGMHRSGLALPAESPLVSTHTCEQCGESFHRRASGRRVHKYCSQRCFGLARRCGTTETTCAQCGEAFQRRAHGSNPPKFCSQRCQRLAVLVLSRKNAASRKKPHIHVCGQCGETFEGRPGAKFCSRRCCGISNRKTLTQCDIPGCDKQRGYGYRYCVMHFARIKRHGDPDTVLRNERIPDPAYRTVHQRLQRDRGRASDYPCAGGCGRPAAQWAYDNADPDERTSIENGYVVPYSTSADHYQPLCVPCHKRFDARRIAGPALETAAAALALNKPEC